MLRMVGHADRRACRASARRSERASWKLSEPSRKSIGRGAEVDRLAVERQRCAGVADAAAADHRGHVGDAHQLRRRAVQAGAAATGRPRCRSGSARVGDPLDQRRPSRRRTPPRRRELTCRISACEPLRSARVDGLSIESTTIPSNSPDTCSTSTGARSRRSAIGRRQVVLSTVGRRRTVQLDAARPRATATPATTTKAREKG